MSFLPPVVMELRANASQFIAEQGKAANAQKTAANEMTQAAQKAAAAARTAAAQAQAATDKRIQAEQKAADASKKAADIQANASGVMSKRQQEAYDQQAAAAQRAANAAELARARETQAHEKAAAAQDTASAAQARAVLSADKADTAVNRLTVSAKSNTEAWKTLGGVTLGFGAAVLLGVGSAVKAYADFDKQMSSVQAATHATSGDMSQLRDAAVKAGADTAFSAKEAAQGIEELSKAGVATRDILAGGLKGSLDLAAAGNLGVGESAELAATAMTQFKLTGDKIPHLADLLSAGAGKAQGSVQDLGMALKQGGLVAASTGLTIEETTAGLASFASAGLLGSDAGTSFKTMLMSLTPNSAAASAEMHKLGIHAYDAQGKFIGLANFAGNLQESMKGLSDEERNASMKIIFGSDAVRAANILYEEGADGIRHWSDEVNVAGYAAQTAAMMQNNLSGDIEKLGGSIDSVFLKSGSGANEVLRGLAQTAEHLVDAIGDLPGPVLQTSLGIGALAGGAALLGGGFLTLFPKIMETKTHLDKLTETGSKVPGTLGKITKAASVAAGALVALQIAGQIFTEKEVKSAEDYGNAILKVAHSVNTIDSTGLDSVFQGWDKVFNMETVQNVDGVSDAVGRLMNHDWQMDVNQFFDGFTSMFGAKSELGQIEDRLKGVGEQMGAIARNGGMETAAKSFRLLSDEFVKNGKTSQDALDKLPGYKDALKGLANEAGAAVDDQTLLNMAFGNLPPEMQKATTATATYTTAAGKTIPISEDVAKKLDEIGVSAAGTVSDLGKFADALFGAGLMSISTSDASIRYREAIDKVSESITKNGTSLDRNTEQGRANESTLNALAKAGITQIQTMAQQTDATGKHVYSQEQLQGSLKDTFEDLKANASKFQLVGETADDAARRVLGIPKDANINTWMSDSAKRMAENTTGAVNGIPKNVSINVAVYGQEAIDAAIAKADTLAASSMIAANRYATGGAYQTPGGFTGGAVDSIMGLASGGIVPGRPPARPNVDNILALVNGRPLKVRSGEFLVNEPQTKANLPWLEAMNAGVNVSDVFAAQATGASGSSGYATMTAQPAVSGGPTQVINIQAQTNATAPHIASEVAWALRTS